MKKDKLLAVVLSALVAASAIPLAGAAASAAPRVASDTPQAISRTLGELYQFKFTVYGTHAKPDIASGNTKVLQAVKLRAAKDKKGDDIYYFEVKAIGRPGTSAGVYATLPGKKGVKECVVTVIEKAVPFQNYYAGFVPDNNKSLKIGEQELPTGDVLLSTEKEWSAFRNKYLRDNIDVGYYSNSDIDFSKYAVLYHSDKWSKQNVMGGTDGLPDKVVISDGKPVLVTKKFGNDYRITAVDLPYNERFVTIVLVKQSSLK